jgi:tmRNA-binding protein
VKGHALFPLSFYWKNGKVKVALAVGRATQIDKRGIKSEADRD